MRHENAALYLEMKRNCNFDLVKETFRNLSSSSTEFQSFGP